MDRFDESGSLQVLAESEDLVSRLRYHTPSWGGTYNSTKTLLTKSPRLSQGGLELMVLSVSFPAYVVFVGIFGFIGPTGFTGHVGWFCRGFILGGEAARVEACRLRVGMSALKILELF